MTNRDLWEGFLLFGRLIIAVLCLCFLIKTKLSFAIFIGVVNLVIELYSFYSWNKHLTD